MMKEQQLPHGSSSHVIRVASKNEHEQIAKALILSFSDDPYIRWLAPEPERLFNYWRVFDAIANKAFQHQSVFTTAHQEGSIVSYKPGTAPDQNRVLDTLKQTVTPEVFETKLKIIELTEKIKPKTEHWYLAMLGVDPFYKKQQFCRALIEYTLNEVDQTQSLCYLESSNVKNLRLYERLGFVSIDQIQVGTSKPLYPMLRQPVRK